MATHNLKLGIIMDPIESINIQKDSSFAMLLAAQRQDWQIFYLQQGAFFQQAESVFAHTRSLHVVE